MDATRRDGAFTLTGARVVTLTGVLDPGWLVVVDGRIEATGTGSPPDGVPASGDSRLDLEGAWVLPGFVDMHCHGGGGRSFAEGGTGARVAAACHREHGTTTLLASLATASEADMAGSVRGLVGLARSGSAPHGVDHPVDLVAGIHLEGPFLARSHCGAHAPELLREPDAALASSLLDAGEGTVRMVTLAPELTGGLDLVRSLVGRGVVAAVGHTDATYAQASAAFAAGASVLTHAGNAMRGFHHREPGPLLAAADAGASCEVINDGVHLHDATVRAIARQVPGRVALITDAIAAAGAGDGDHRLGPRTIEVRDGVARLARAPDAAEGAEGPLAGSTLTMDRAVRRAVVDVGLPIATVAAAAATAPARTIGLGGVTGQIAPGYAADLVVLDHDLAVAGVCHRGTWTRHPDP